MQYMLIRNARLVGQDKPQNVLVADGRIVSIGTNTQHPILCTEDVDANEKYVLPSLPDLLFPLTGCTTPDRVNDVNFRLLSSGIGFMMAAATDLDEGITEMESLGKNAINYGIHVPLRQVSLSDVKHFSRLMLQNGVATAAIRLGDEKRASIESLTQSISAARAIGLHVVYDMRSLVTPSERISTLESLCTLLSQDSANHAYIIGIEHEEEIEILRKCRTLFNLTAHICYDPFGPSANGLTKMTASSIIDTLRQSRWCSLGIAYSESRAAKEGWPDMTPELIERNKLPILAGMSSESPLSVEELMEFAISRPYQMLGLAPALGTVEVGSSANFLIWDATIRDSAIIASPRGNQQEIILSGRVDSHILNGHLVFSDKYHNEAVIGKRHYSRFV